MQNPQAMFLRPPAAGRLETPLHPRPHNTRDYRLDPKPPRARRVVVVRLAVGASAYLSGGKRCNDFGPSL